MHERLCDIDAFTRIYRDGDNRGVDRRGDRHHLPLHFRRREHRRCLCHLRLFLMQLFPRRCRLEQLQLLLTHRHIAARRRQIHRRLLHGFATHALIHGQLLLAIIVLLRKPQRRFSFRHRQLRDLQLIRPRQCLQRRQRSLRLRQPRGGLFLGGLCQSIIQLNHGILRMNLLTHLAEHLRDDPGHRRGQIRPARHLPRSGEARRDGSKSVDVPMHGCDADLRTLHGDFVFCVIRVFILRRVPGRFFAQGGN